MASKGKVEALVVQSKVKNLVKKAKMKCSSDVVSRMSVIVAQTLAKGCERAKANGRKTVRGADL